MTFPRRFIALSALFCLAVLVFVLFDEDERASLRLASREFVHRLAIASSALANQRLRALVLHEGIAKRLPPPAFNVTLCSLVSNDNEALRLPRLYANVTRSHKHDEWIFVDNRHFKEVPLFAPTDEPTPVFVHTSSRAHDYSEAFTHVLWCLESHAKKLARGERNVFVKIDPDAYVPPGRFGPLLADVVSTCDTKSKNFTCAFGNAMMHPVSGVFFSGLLYGATFRFPFDLVNRKDESYAAEDLYFATVLLKSAELRAQLGIIDLHRFVDVKRFDPGNDVPVVQHASVKVHPQTI